MNAPFHWTDDAESTSAKLRRVEQERDDTSRYAAELERRLRNVRAELASARTELDDVRTARDALERQLAETGEPEWHKGCTWCWRTCWHSSTASAAHEPVAVIDPGEGLLT